MSEGFGFFLSLAVSFWGVFWLRAVILVVFSAVTIDLLESGKNRIVKERNQGEAWKARRILLDSKISGITRSFHVFPPPLSFATLPNSNPSEMSSQTNSFFLLGVGPRKIFLRVVGSCGK